MKIVLMWGEKEPEMRVIFDALKKEGHEVVYWVGDYGTEHLTPPGAAFHDHYEAWGATPAKSLEHELREPASTKLIDSMAHLESHLLTMMNKRYNTCNVDERKHVYFTMLAYWNYVLDRYKPDCIVFGVVPHSIYANIVDEMAKQRGIKRICLEDTWIDTHTLVYRDFWKGSDELRAALHELKNKPVSENDLCDGLRKYWNMQMGTGGVAPIYTTAQEQTFAGSGNILRHFRIITAAIKNGNLARLVVGNIARRFQKNLSHEYAEIVQAPAWEVPFVYFPLSHQPERTSSPQGLVYADLLLAAETLAAAVPKGWEVWVKEHPTQWWNRTKRYSSVRYPGYYHRLANIPNVRVVPIKTDSFQLIEKAAAVAVTTGTPGWEALLKGKRPLTFGIPWWRDCPGVFRVSDVASCRSAFAAIQNGAIAEKEDILRFLIALEKTSIHAHIEPFDAPLLSAKGLDKSIMQDRNIPGIMNRLCDELRRIDV